MTGFEPQTSGIGSDRSTNWAKTTACISLVTAYLVGYFRHMGNLIFHLGIFKLLGQILN